LRPIRLTRFTVSPRRCSARIRSTAAAPVRATARTERRFEHGPLGVGQVHAVEYDGDPTDVSRGFRIYQTASSLIDVFTLDQVVPWGRSFDEYRRMFGLTEDDLNRTIIGCGDGPASFNADSTRQGRRVISCDPLYRFEKVRIEERIAATFDEIVE
jgi:hypothetical protein